MGVMLKLEAMVVDVTLAALETEQAAIGQVMQEGPTAAVGPEWRLLTLVR